MEAMIIPQCNPLASYQRLKVDIDAAISAVLAQGRYVLGDQVAAFEKEFADYHGGGHAVGVANGTDGLEMALRALGVVSGTKVYTVSHTAVATVAAIEKAGAIPILVDIDPKSYTMCPLSLQSALKAHPSGGRDVVVVVHLYGQPAVHWQSIADVAKSHGLLLVEDCSQAHGAEWRGCKVGTLGEAAAFSLYPTKNLGAIGDGGVCFMKDHDLAAKLRSLREYGWKERYVSEVPGGNSRLDELQAAILRIKLKHLDKDNNARRRIASLYFDGIENPRISMPAKYEDGRHVYHQFVVRSPNRDDLREHLKARNIGTLIHYPVPIHRQPAYEGRLPMPASGLPETEKAAGTIASLPMFPELEDDAIERIVTALNDWVS